VEAHPDTDAAVRLRIQRVVPSGDG
jgi:hypothetical protein